MAHHSLLRFPRPKAFLYIMSLRTGTELITTTLIINKVTGFYGLLALFTGLHLSPLQLSMYFYSILALGLAAYLAPHIRKQSPLQCLALAWFYALDSVINAAYTATFGITWFVVLSQRNGPAPGGKTMKDASGFTKVAPSDAGVAEPQDHAMLGARARSTGTGSEPLGQVLFQGGSMASLSVIALLWIVRVYFMFVVMAYARVVLRQHIVRSSWQPSAQYPGTSSEKDGVADDPFAEEKEQGKGWKGKLGRIMVGCGRRYWLGVDDAETWTQSKGVKMERVGGAPGTIDRERRRRAGTGPSGLPPQLKTELRNM